MTREQHETALAQLEEQLRKHERETVRRWPRMSKGDVDVAYRKAQEIREQMAPHKAAITRAKRRTGVA